ERIEIIRDLRLKKYDVLVGINLLREGLDIPEVSLVAILDADKEGFLRSERSLIQTMGRAARNEHGRVVMYADKITDSMQYAIDETNRRREIQEAYNVEHNVEPQTIQKEVRGLIQATEESADEEQELDQLSEIAKITKEEKKEKNQKQVRRHKQETVETADEEQELDQLSEIAKLPKAEKMEKIELLEEEMRAAAKELDFERATQLRDIVLELKAAV